jgi:hypothetical protein
LEIEQYTFEWSVDHWRNKGENKKITRNKWKISYQNLWDTVRAVLKGKFIARSAYINKSERSQISNLMIYFKFLEKQEQSKPHFTDGVKS